MFGGFVGPLSISGLTQKTGVVFKITNDFKELMDLRYF